MKHRFFGFLSLFIFLTGLFAGCSSDSEEDNYNNNISVRISQSSITLVSDNEDFKTFDLTATVTGYEKDSAINWSSSDSKIATVSNGHITAVGKGTATIYARNNENPKRPAECKVKVLNFSEAPSYSLTIPGGDDYFTLGSDAQYDGAMLKVDSKGKVTFTTSSKAECEVKAQLKSGFDNGSFKVTKGNTAVYTSEKLSSSAKTYKFELNDAGTYVLQNASEQFDLISLKVTEQATTNVVYPTGISLSENTKSLDLTNEETSFSLTATLSPSGITKGLDEIIWTSSDTSIATVSNGIVKAKKAGNATITASSIANKFTASCELTVTGVLKPGIRADDVPMGFAGTNWNLDVSKMTVVIATTPSELQTYARQGNKIIYVDGANGVMDMSGGLLPAIEKTSTDFDSAMDAWVASNSSYKTYKEWFEAKSNCSTSSAQGVDGLSSKFTNLTRITLASNTIIIGINNAVIRGGNISIGSINNVVIRNLTLQDGIDPFPHHELTSSGASDGFNAQNDCIGIDGGKNIWIDHCTLEDTLHCGTAANGEKWQVYDGLCDMKSDCTNITVSYCHFKNHDKTMLIGSGDSDGDNTKRFVTLAGNYFENCGQRLPMVRNTRIHVYGNYYENDGSWYRSQSSINARKNAIVCEHNNTFASGASPSTKDGNIYSDVSKIFDVAPRYEFDSISPSKENAGAGLLGVIK